MAKRIFASATACLLFTAALPAHSSIQASIATGCDLLSESVQAAVLRAAHRHRTGFSIQTVEVFRRSGKSGEVAEPVKTCGDTSQVTTAAFSTAFESIGLAVGWHDDPINPGEYCGSDNLSECYPFLTQGFVTSGVSNPSLVKNAWKAVRKSISGFMPYGALGNLSSFEGDALRFSLRASLAVFVQGSEYQVVEAVNRRSSE